MRSFGLLISVTVALFLGDFCWSETSPNSVVKRKYPARVYEMYKERQKNKSQKEPGVWSPWSEWSSCSRSCGGGVTQQTRQCVSPQTMKERYAHKHRRRRQEKRSMNHCVGLYKRMHLCNTQECPVVRDFRTEQCASFNNRPFKGKIYIWQPYKNVLPQYECALNCEAVGGGFYARLNETVIDGTPCSNPAKIHGKRPSFGALSVCVDGYCQSVASNGIIGAIEDSEENCAMCLNGNCRNVSGLYMRPDVPKGYNFIAQIPHGACRILVQQLKPTRNIIGLRYSNGTSILNGEWKFSGSSKVVEAAGTKFNYRKQDGTSLETVTSPGPLALPVEIMFFAHQMNPGIKYEYLLPVEGNLEQIVPPLLNPLPNEILPEPRRLDIPLNTLNQKDEAKPNPHRRYRNRRRFQWKISGLTPCSKSCGGGTQEPIIICVREHTQIPVIERRCANIEKPNPHPIKCNTQQCVMGSWGGRWGPCVGSCKHAVQYYIISCLQHSPNGQTTTLKDDECSPPKPESHSRPCRMPGCEVDNELSVQPDDADDIRRLYKDWHAGTWSPCSVSCGTGHRSRPVTCPSGLCHPEKRPADSEFCENGPCSESGSPSHWLLTEWSQCSESCGTGNQTRRSFCSKNNCDDESKPETIRACSSEKDCGGKWFTGPWSSCSDACSGQATEKREVYCVVKLRGHAKITTEMTCPAHKPETERACHGGCPPSWHVGEWGACEGNCPSGMQRREVRCLDGNGRDTNYCNTDEMPILKRACTCARKEDPRDRYQPIHDEPNDRTCVDKIRNCILAVQARLCKYPYYKTHCCESCRNK